MHHSTHEPDGHPVDALLANYAAGLLTPVLSALVASHLELKPHNRRFVADLERLGGALIEDLPPQPLRDRDARIDAIFRANGVGHGTNGHSNGHTNGHSNGHGYGSNGHGSHGHNGNGHATNDHGNGHDSLYGHATGPVAHGWTKAHHPVAGHVSPAEAASSGIILPRALRRLIGGDLDRLAWKTKLPGLKSVTIPTDDGTLASFYWIRAGKPMPTHTHDGFEVTLVLTGGFSDITGHYERGDVAVADEHLDHRPVADDDGEDCICFAVAEAPVKLTGPIGRVFQRFIRR